MQPICLITPPSIFLLDERVFITLGILKVASSLEQAGRKVEMVDLSGIENYEQAIADHAATSHAAIFGITATTPQMPSTTKILKAIRNARPDARVILGGPHVTLCNAAWKREKKLGQCGRATRAMNQLSEMFDVLVCGDGEDAVFGSLVDSPQKIIDADDPASPLFLTNARFDELPFPARHLIDVSSYNYTIDNVRALSLIGQLGCPFVCGFCGGRESPMLRRIRNRTTRNIVDEIAHIHKVYGANGFMLYDDELNVSPKMIELMNLIREEQKVIGQEFRLRGFIKSQLFTDEQAASMREAGFRWVLIGFESGSPRILENINKKASREDNTRCMEIAARHDLKVKALMSIGHPGESPETIQDTKEWLLEVKPADFDVTCITTYPGTPYFDHAIRSNDVSGEWVYSYPKNGDRLHQQDLDYTTVADFYKGHPGGGYQAYVYTDYLSAKDLVVLRDQVESDVRKQLNIPFNQSAAAMRYEHSMGQSGQLPGHILRKTT